ncbi:cell death activator CIDE-A [Erpetoichthys calabaricus]|uniref:CIDE-N domain-containing protein n=1 Tax=Erpetoichthys calabaricus TaxID=27687 RepID=A0A8C4RRY6_ERPCA|nr:cell death activator CIDE-A [Erpetoichthys calabaricus]
MRYARECASVLSPRSLMRSVTSVGSSISRRVLYYPEVQLRPFRVCNYDRSSRKGVVAGTLDDLISKALAALPHRTRSVTLVLEEDGTVVDNEEFFQSLEMNTLFMLLEEGKRWRSARSVSSTRHSKKKGIAKVTFDLYKLNPKDFIGCLNIKATFYEMYTMSYDIKCMGAKHILKKLLRYLSYIAQVTGQFLLYGSTYVLQYTDESSDIGSLRSPASASNN